MKTIGFIGIGLMGLPMCHRLLKAGHPLIVWNRSPEKCSVLVQAGATMAADAKSVATLADIIMLCVADTAAVDAILHGSHGLLAALSHDKIVVDFSSIDPVATREFAEAAHAQHAHWIDAPVSGGVPGAETGTLVVMAGGDEKIIDDLRPVLASLAQRVTRMGPNGAGQVTKICNQLIVAANAVLIAEALALAEKAGVDTSKLAPALAGGFADSKPFQLLAPRMSARQFEPLQWRVQTLLKDLDMALTLAQQLDSDTPLAANAAERLRLHGEHGFLDTDLSSLINLYAGDKKPC